MAHFKSMNDVDAAFDSGLKEVNGQFVCPVCGKTYKRKTAAEKHLNERNCADLKAIFSGTSTEMYAFNMYKTLVLDINPSAKVSYVTFKKSPHYNPAVRFAAVVAYHDLQPLAEQYMAWISLTRKANHVNQIFAYGIKPEVVRTFRIDAHVHDLMDSEKFFDRYADELVVDESFLVRSLEKAKIGIKFVLTNQRLDSVLEKMQPDYMNRIADLTEMVKMRKSEYEKNAG